MQSVEFGRVKEVVSFISHTWHSCENSTNTHPNLKKDRQWMGIPVWPVHPRRWMVVYSMCFYIPNTPWNTSSVWLKSHKLLTWLEANHTPIGWAYLQSFANGPARCTAAWCWYDQHEDCSLRKPIVEPTLSSNHLSLAVTCHNILLLMWWNPIP